VNFLPIMLNPNLSGQDVKDLIDLDTEMRLRLMDRLEESANRVPKGRRTEFISMMLPLVLR